MKNKKQPERVEQTTMTINSHRIDARITRFSEIEGMAEERLPYWARSTNPIVRRHLGLYWRTVPPESRPFTMMYMTWVALMAIGVLVPPLFGFTMITFLASIMILPLSMLLYGYVLLGISADCARMMQQEMNNNTFQLLQATPMSLTQIFLGKVAAAIWRRMDDIVMIAQIAVAFSPPVLFYFYSEFWPFGSSNILIAPTVTMLATIIVAVRIILEPVMIGALAVFVGLVVEGRTRAITAAVVLGGFYFVLLNLAAHLPIVRGYTAADGTEFAANLPLLFLFDFVLPILLPIFISYGLLKLSARIVSSK